MTEPVTLELARENIGAGVVYRKPWMQQGEDGVITGVGDHYIFVRYSGDTGSKATAAEDLAWLSTARRQAGAAS